MKIKYKNKVLFIKVKTSNFFGQLFGLMFRSRNTKNLFFERAIPIHSFFVFFSFLAIWLRNDRLIKAQIVKPFTLSVYPPKNATALLELPIKKKNAKIIKLFVGKKKDLNIC